MINGVDVIVTIGMVVIGFVMGFLAAVIFLFMWKDDSGKEGKE